MLTNEEANLISQCYAVIALSHGAIYLCWRLGAFALFLKAELLKTSFFGKDVYSRGEGWTSFEKTVDVYKEACSRKTLQIFKR